MFEFKTYPAAIGGASALASFVQDGIRVGQIAPGKQFRPVRTPESTLDAATVAEASASDRRLHSA